MSVLRRFAVLIILLLTVGGMGVIYYCLPPRAALVPPNPPAEDLEPAVVAAISVKRERVLKEPDSAPAWGGLGQVFIANELGAEARVCFEEAARLDPRDPRWPYLQAKILVNYGEQEKAVPLFEQAIEVSTADPVVNRLAHLVLAETLLALARTGAAEPHVRQVRDHDPDDLRARFDDALLAMAVEDWPRARDLLESCLDSPFARKSARTYLAAVSRRLGADSRANDYQAEAGRLTADADWPDSLVEAYLQEAVKKRTAYQLAASLETQGRFGEARLAAQVVVSNFPDDDNAQGQLGRLLAQMGDDAGAEAALEAAIRLAPDKIQHRYTRSVLRVKQGDVAIRAGRPEAAAIAYRAAAEDARKALAIKPDYGLAHMSLGLALKGLGQLAEAVKELEEGVRCSPEYASIHQRLAEVLDTQGRSAEAVVQYRRALALSPPSAPWRVAVEARLKELGTDPKK
jgi:tetratricopeptide (TPR) repeat protein